MSVPARTPAPSGAPLSARSARTRAAVLEATASLMAQAGLAGTTIDAIHQRSGVSKTTIYKHWPNRLCVAVDAFAQRLEIDAALPDTGTVRGDLAEQLRRVRAFYASPLGAVFAQLLASAAQDRAAGARLAEHLRRSRQHGIEQLWQRAVARGEVRADLDPDVAVDLLFAPVMWRVVTARAPLGDAEADALVNAALSGLLHPAPAGTGRHVEAAGPRPAPLAFGQG